MKARDLCELLALKYPAPQWALCYEVAPALGFLRQPRYADAIAVGLWPSGGCPRFAFEVKVSRADFRRELNNPDKRKWLEEEYERTYFVAPFGLLKPDEIPEGWGLLQAQKNGAKLREAKIAPARRLDPWPDAAMGFLRRMSEEMEDTRGKLYRLGDQDVTPQQFAALVRRDSECARGRMDKAREKLRQEHHEYFLKLTKLEAPLKVLDNYINGKPGYRREREPLTAGHVHEYFGQLKDKASERVRYEILAKLTDAHHELGKLLDACKANGGGR